MLLRDKNIVFIGPKTFNYEREICSAIQGMGARVFFASDKPWESTLMKAAVRLCPKLLWSAADKHYQSWLDSAVPKDVDVVLVIKGEGLSPRMLSNLRARYPGARFVLYLWDSIANVKYAEEKLMAFDSKYSFDPDDCRRHADFKYRPLFFLDSYRKTGSQKIGKGCFFLGTLNGDRPAVLVRLLGELQSATTFDYWLFVRSSMEKIVRMIFDPAVRRLDRSRFLQLPMSSSEAASHIERCAAVVDIEHPNQSGLTMRTFEVLASGKKLITTNRNIKDHEFYDSARICVISRTEPIVPDGFLESIPMPLSEHFFQKYSLVGWLTEIMGCDTAVCS